MIRIRHYVLRNQLPSPLILLELTCDEAVHIQGYYHLATSISQHPVLLDRKRCCLVVHSSDLAIYEVVQACDSGGRP